MMSYQQVLHRESNSHKSKWQRMEKSLLAMQLYLASDIMHPDGKVATDDVILHIDMILREATKEA